MAHRIKQKYNIPWTVTNDIFNALYYQTQKLGLYPIYTIRINGSLIQLTILDSHTEQPLIIALRDSLELNICMFSILLKTIGYTGLYKYLYKKYPYEKHAVDNLYIDWCEFIGCIDSSGLVKY